MDANLWCAILGLILISCLLILSLVISANGENRLTACTFTSGRMRKRPEVSVLFFAHR